ncbi:Fur family transcriptional regulator [Bifidobacterium gallicum]|uniref:Peptide ABC transporter substrate-binding protein n=1 Tax=Bifidobacterium gallicum DSM 20093 = LMG 11596 TaxID=561180 RepID=D1NUQ6_9BIFI|nr:Fur family transcriptional regulator [Bifidobacterium gallicum]EFA22557.1 transcriptional regulator, Fur family [Bifidobacterium gallicum DSM 20093 = LMG 11596]KFI59546.1 peptide ABC transporter substrate-binding protein [Bifidobacterium gallicum DSM 20093 = LMG 11596]
MVVRRTKQRDAIVQQLQGNSRFISAQELHDQLVEAGQTIGLATVYRQLNDLVESGDVDSVQLAGEQLFRLCQSEEHHHHIICTRCGRTVQIEPPSEAWLQTIAQRTGYTVESHTLEVFGLCPECQQHGGGNAANAA